MRWGRTGRPLRVLFFDPSAQLRSLEDLRVKGRGGMVSSLVKVPDGLRALGHHTCVCASIELPGDSHGGTPWVNASAWPDLCRERWDVLVFNRGMGEDGGADLQARHRVLWVHDLVHSGWMPEPQRARGLASVVFMSRYARRSWRTYYPALPRGVIIPNGVDLELFKPVDKDPRLVINANAPNRGLRQLAQLAILLRQRVPDVRVVYFGNMREQHPADRGDYEAAYAAARESGIEMMGCVPQSVLAEWMARSSLMLIPNSYPEICSNVTLQALASGIPIVTTDAGSATEWIRDGWNGAISQHRAEDGWVCWMELLRASVRILEDAKWRQRLASNARRTPRLYSWSEIARQWDRMLHSL